MFAEVSSLFFRSALLTPEGVAALRRLDGARVDREFGNLPHVDAYAVFSVQETPQGVRVGISHSASKDPKIRSAYFLKGLEMALGVSDEPLARARENEQAQRAHFRKLGEIVRRDQ